MISVGLTIRDPVTEALNQLSDPTSRKSERVYLTSNEECQERTREELAAIERVAKGCHIGVSSFQNFDIMAARKSEYAILFDANPNMNLFLEKAIAIIKEVPDRISFFEKMSDEIKEEPFGENGFWANPLWQRMKQTYNYHYQQEFEGELRREGSFLATDEAFEYIQMLAQTDRIAILSLNILQTEVFEKMKAILRENEITVDTLYTSNICDYMHVLFEPEKDRELKEGYINTIRTLEPHILIHCPRPEWHSGRWCDPEQTVTKGEDVMTLDSRLFFRIPNKR